MKLGRNDAAGLALGIELVLSIVLAGGIGWWVDQRYHTYPTWFLVGFAVGTAAGLRSVLRFARRAQQADSDETPKKP